MHPVVRQLLRPENLPAYLAIVLAVVGMSFSNEKQVTAILIVLGLVSASSIAERITYFREMLDAIRRGRIGLRSRDGGDFEEFGKYIQSGREVFVAGLSLNFICTHKQRELRDGILNGMHFRFVMIDPALSDDAMAMVADHDERLNVSHTNLRKEIIDSVEVLRGIKNIRRATGSLSLKAGKGMPVLTVTMVDPNRSNGKIRVEMRPYKRNFGPRPYLEFRRDCIEDTYWYNQIYNHYYQQLWEDSPDIPL